MHQPRSSEDFGAFEPGRNRVKRNWIMLSSLLALVLILSAGLGFGLGRGLWAVPDSAKNRLPRFFANWLLPPEHAPPATSTAELKSYAFELAGTKARKGEAILSVRLVYKPTGRPVSDAVIFARRLDMAPEGMPTMTANLQPVASSDAGIYRFKANLTMQGKWQLSLAAKVQGERGTVQNKLVVEATP